MSEDKIIDNLQEILEEFTRAQPEVQGQILIAFPEGGFLQCFLLPGFL